MTQEGCYQLVLDRRLGEYVLPDGWVVIADGNPASERGVHFAMPRPLRNRFVHLDLEPDLDDWCREYDDFQTGFDAMISGQTGQVVLDWTSLG
jgi:MoxR-like ATPase